MEEAKVGPAGLMSSCRVAKGGSSDDGMLPNRTHRGSGIANKGKSVVDIRDSPTDAIVIICRLPACHLAAHYHLKTITNPKFQLPLEYHLHRQQALTLSNEYLQNIVRPHVCSAECPKRLEEAGVGRAGLC